MIGLDLSEDIIKLRTFEVHLCKTVLYEVKCESNKSYLQSQDFDVSPQKWV